MMDLEALEAFLRGLIRGEFSSLTLSFNESNGPNYQSIEQEEREGMTHGDWISEEERERGMATNSKWVLQWYPDTPVGFHAIAASSLPALVGHLAERVADYR